MHAAKKYESMHPAHACQVKLTTASRSTNDTIVSVGAERVGPLPHHLKEGCMPQRCPLSPALPHLLPVCGLICVPIFQVAVRNGERDRVDKVP